MHLLEGLSAKQASDICVHKCGAQCCKGSNILSLYPEEASLLKQKAEEFKRPLKLRQDEEGNFYLRLVEQANSQCPMLGPDNRCQVYDNRPICCQRYPHRKIDGCYISGGGYKVQMAKP